MQGDESPLNVVISPMPDGSAHLHAPDAAADLRAVVAGRRFATILADPPWQFQNSTGKVAPEHRRLNRYATLTLPEIEALGRGSA